MKNALASWKATVTGFLSFLITTGVVIIGFTVSIPGQKMAKVTTGLTIGLALCRAWMGLIQQDADKTQAVVPGGEVKTVAAHSVPDNPANVAVPEGK